MSDRSESFGRVAIRASSPAAFLVVEAEHGRSDQFRQIDDLLKHLLIRSLSEERLVIHEYGRDAKPLALRGLDLSQRAFVDTTFVLAQQQARGAWFLPEDANLELGSANLPYHFRTHPRFAMGIASEERGKFRLHDSTDAFFFWAVLEPLFAQLFLPFELRGPLIGKKDQEWQRKAWAEAEVFLDALGFVVEDALKLMRYGSGWSKLRAEQQLQVKQTLMGLLRNQATEVHGQRFRAYQIQRLIAKYYQQAKKNPPKLRQVLTKEFQRPLAGFFGGDWLAFLGYIGEEPHPDKRIATALPETRLIVSDRDRIAAAAAAQGLPVEEVERAVAAFWGTAQETSPVDERVAVLRDFWRAFDEIHARQESGMLPLWGLIDDGGISLTASTPYQPGLYRSLLAADILEKIDRLWGTCMLTRWPERIVSTLSPHELMAGALGPALKFWHGCSLTAWFVCEGPFSRTDLPGLATYYDKDLSALEHLGSPIDPALFAELMDAESRLGPPQPVKDSERSSRHEIGVGLYLEMDVVIGNRRPGFEILRDIITRHRRRWSERFLDTYLRARWESEIRDAARDHHLLSERKGKAPNPKQFATHALVATNHWFGGDISRLYRMIGEKAPVEPERRIVVPDDREGFARAALNRLLERSEATPTDSTRVGTDAERAQEQTRWNLQWMAEECLFCLQCEEALGRAPTLDEFGRERFAYRAAALAPDVEIAWTIYQRAIAMAKQSHSRDSTERGFVYPSPRLDVAGSTSLPAAISPVDTSVPVGRDAKDRKPLWRRLLGGR